MSTTDERVARIAEFGWRHPASAIRALTNPAVATGFTVAMPGTSETVVQSVSFRLVSDSNVAARSVVVQYLDPDGIPFATVASPFTQAASLTADYTFAVGIQQFGANNAAVIGAALPPYKLVVGLSLVVAVSGVQAGDQVSRVRLALQQWHVRP